MVQQFGNLKTIRTYGWLTRLKGNRQVNPDATGNRALQATEIAAEGTVVHLKGHVLIRVLRIVTPDGDTEDWATNDLTLPLFERERWAGRVWTIEEYHRGLKQFRGVERCQARRAHAQRNRIGTCGMDR